ncbi:MAG: tetratricopeptide repeat protein [Thaumarchaeota archaeon]|nr:tetratricopeptide repeat protein [Nitrososphaerota archaeon]
MSFEQLVEKGRKFLTDGKYFEALECFEDALIIKNNDPDLLNYKGVVLRSMGRYDEASECFNKSLEIDPRDKDSS